MVDTHEMAGAPVRAMTRSNVGLAVSMVLVILATVVVVSITIDDLPALTVLYGLVLLVLFHRLRAEDPKPRVLVLTCATFGLVVTLVGSVTLLAGLIPDG